MTTTALSTAGKLAASKVSTISAGEAGSVGVVNPVFIRFDEPLPLASGQSLPSYELAVETYGVLNDLRYWSAMP